MEYVLMDIKNFLKKLENGQMEIEAGQWQLHKTLTSMSKTVTELSNLKEDVADMKRSNLHQMGLIKDLQSKLDKMNQTSDDDNPVTVSESSVEYESLFKRPIDGQAPPKGFKKRKCHIRSEEIIEITSQMSNEKPESELGQSHSRTQQCPVAIEENEYKSKSDKNSDEESSRNVYKKESYIIPTQNKGTSHYPAHTSNDILQRYLKDSVKYLENKKSESSDMTLPSSKYKEQDKSYTETEYRPFWDEYSSRIPPEAHHENGCSNFKENTGGAVSPKEYPPPKTFSCPRCPKKFTSKGDIMRHKKKHRISKGLCRCKDCGKGFSSKIRLREHEEAHKFSSKGFKGFKCCYCCKICLTPEKLTDHLRKCRNLMKPQLKKK